MYSACMNNSNMHTVASTYTGWSLMLCRFIYKAIKCTCKNETYSREKFDRFSTQFRLWYTWEKSAKQQLSSCKEKIKIVRERKRGRFIYCFLFDQLLCPNTHKHLIILNEMGFHSEVTSKDYKTNGLWKFERSRNQKIFISF